MLSRVADALYWMARYVERAEHAARVLDETQSTIIDLEDVDAERARATRINALDQIGVAPDVPWRAAVFDEQILGSVASSLVRARENARQVREVISPEMWDGINRAHWSLAETKNDGSRPEFLSGVLEEVIRSSYLWSGITDATMGRGTPWLFIRLGQFVERADRVARTFSRLWPELEAARTQDVGQGPDDNIGWLLLLRSCAALDEYRKRYPTRFDIGRIVTFVLLDPGFPRTVRYSTRVAATFAERLRAEVGERGDVTQRAFGRLAALVEFAEVDEVLHEGPESFLGRVTDELRNATHELQRSFFLH